MSDDPIGDLAHLITGCINATCCHRTGGHNKDYRCECRSIAIQLFDCKDDVLEILQRGDQKGEQSNGLKEIS